MLGKNLIEIKEEKIPYMTDASFFVGNEPLAVALPGSEDEIISLVRFCNENEIPLVARGGGTSLTGSSIPLNGYIVLSLSRLNRILDINTSDRYVVAEPGVRLDDLNAQLAKLNFFYPPDPASSQAATVGGSISTNAGGLRASMYGTTKNWVLGVDVILGNGQKAIFGGRVLKSSAGYDLTALMIGAEGTLGVITKATLKILPRPEKTGRILAFFDAIEKVGNAVRDLKRSGITPLIAEFLDRITMNSLTKSKGLYFPEEASHMLILDIASTEESIQRHLNLAKEVIKRSEPLNLEITTDPDEMARIYEARKGAYSALLRERDSPNQRVVIGDVAVPASQLPDALQEAQESAKSLGIKVALFGHISDGNIHANIFADLADEDEMRRIEEYQLSLAKIAVERGGVVSAEHGVGIEKKDLLKLQYEHLNSPETLQLMKDLKKVLDPHNIMNRGKIFD